MKIENYLCSNARPSPKKFNHGACQTCISPCGPGLKWLASLGLDTPKRLGMAHVDIPYLSRTAKLKMLLNKGC